MRKQLVFKHERIISTSTNRQTWISKSITATKEVPSAEDQREQEQAEGEGNVQVRENDEAGNEKNGPCCDRGGE